MTIQSALPVEGMAKDKFNMSPAVVRDKFLADWETELEGKNYDEGFSMDTFFTWYVQRYGASEKSMYWLWDSRIYKTLQDEFAKRRKQSGKKSIR